MPVAVDIDLLQDFADRFRSHAFATHRLAGGERYFRLMETKYTDLLGSGPGSSRFSDPRLGIPGVTLFSVVYGATGLATAFEEVVLRDTTDGAFAPHVLRLSLLKKYHGGFFRATAPVLLADLTTSGNLRKVGVPTDIVRYSSHVRSQFYAYAVYSHPAGYDGIRYRSRFTGEINVAIFDRSIRALFIAEPIHPLLAYNLAPILGGLHLLVDPTR